MHSFTHSILKVVIIKYNAGNVQSVMYALERIGASYELSDNADVIRSAERIIFPGVGEASTAMRSLRENGLDKVIPTLKQPFLGTCVGMQLLCQSSAENNTECLGVFDIPILKFPRVKGFKVPQTGWNNISPPAPTRGGVTDTWISPLCKGLSESEYVYYNHGYYAPLCDYTVAKTDYILEYSAMLQRDNFFAAQFHSEISGDVGEQIFKNFLEI
nr:imidazole glycerol phosphate synthase subunit HisH [uncultured Emticicia sp.]